MRRGSLAMFVAAAGCDRVITLNPPVDAAQPCEAGGAFGAGEPVPIAGAYSVEAARFNGAQTIAYLSLCPTSGDAMMCDLYTSPFTLATNSFTSFARLTGVSSANYYDSYPTITPDGEHMLFGSRRLDGTLRTWVATATNSSFDAPTFTQLALPAGKTTSNEPYLLGDGRTVYFSGAEDLFSTRGDAPAFGGMPVAVPGINTADSELAPVLADDELEIFFASNRQQPEEILGLDIYTATRESAADDFEMPRRIAALSAADTGDWPLWLSPDRCSLYYINKVFATNLATLYVARR